jgi:hypothetical protein
MNTELFKEYADLKTNIKLMEARVDELNKTLLEQVLEAGADTKVQVPQGSFTIMMRKKWTYPPEVLQLREELKQEEKIAQQTATATFEEEPTLMFRVAKGETVEDN